MKQPRKKQARPKQIWVVPDGTPAAPKGAKGAVAKKVAA